MERGWKKRLVAVIIAIMSMMILAGCGTSEEPEVPETEDVAVTEEETIPEEDAEEQFAEEESTADAADVGSDYEVEKEYVLRENLRVREEPSADSRWIKRSELTEGDKAKAITDEDAVLEKGEFVTCKEISGDWMRIDSGWICCKDDNNTYVIEPTILFQPDEENWDYYKGYYYDENGDLFYITETEKPLTGTYRIAGLDDSITFNSDGTCTRNTDPGDMPAEFAHVEGNYNYRNGKVYFREGGSFTVVVYEIDGNTLLPC